MSLAKTPEQKRRNLDAIKRMRDGRRARGECIECTAPAPNYARCLQCRLKANAANWRARHGVAA